MSHSISALCFFIFFVFFSIFIANFASIISTDELLDGKLNIQTDKVGKSNNFENKNILGNKNEHLLWFLQISDIHISMFGDQDRITQFRDFVNNTIDIIKPKVVLASGDLTDGKELNKLGSRQFLKEWEIYKNVLSSVNIENKTLWMDIRGNHDNFNVPSMDSVSNYFNKYSIQGKQHERSYMYQINEGTEKYTFIAVDACLDPGPKRPFNFIGLLDINDTKRLIHLNEKARDSGTNFTIWFGHYPTSCILSPGTGNGGIRDIIGKFDETYAYLCGHLHTQGGMVPKMYTLHKNGFLEIELGDWMKNRLFRVAAFDHGLFSFVDVHYNDWPIILITNPKDALLNIPHKENPNLQLHSTHIRLLIFSPSAVETCRVKVDTQNEIWSNCQQVSENLYVVPWNPLKYDNGIHNLLVHVRTSNGRTKNFKHPFSLDGTRINFNLMARIVLMMDATKLFQALFGLALVGCVVPLCAFRIVHELVRFGKLKRPRIKSRCLKSLIQNIWILSTVDRIFMPLIFYCVYISIGPWAIGAVIDNYIGFVFVWGIFVNNSFIPGTLTYLYGFFQLTFCQFPLIFVYGNLLGRRYRSFYDSCSNTRIKKSFIKLRMIIKNIPFILIILVEIGLASVFWWAYGTLAFLLGPFRTWSVIMHILLFYLSANIPEKSLESAYAVWQ